MLYFPRRFNREDWAVQERTVSDIVYELHRTLGLPGVRHDEEVLQNLYRHGGLVHLTYHMQQHVRLPCRIVLGKVRSGKGDLPAWIRMPSNIEIFGTRAFRRQTVELFLRNSFVASVPFPTLVYAVAHELAHVVLYATKSPLHHSERATDVCAMMLGYEHMVQRGYKYMAREVIEEYIPPWWKRVLGVPSTRRIEMRAGRVGYLHDGEYSETLTLIEHLRTLRTRA